MNGNVVGPGVVLLWLSCCCTWHGFVVLSCWGTRRSDMFLARCRRVRPSRVCGMHAADACVCGARSDECRWRQAVTAAGWAEPSSCGSTRQSACLCVCSWLRSGCCFSRAVLTCQPWQGSGRDTVVLFDVTRRHTPLSGGRRVCDGLGKLNSLLPPMLLPGPCLCAPV